MKYLILSLLFSGVSTAATVVYEINEGKVFGANLTDSTYTLNTSSALGLITEFRGPCGSTSCEVPALTPFSITYSVAGATSCVGSGGVTVWRRVQSAEDGTYVIDVPYVDDDTSFFLTCSTNTKEHILRVDIIADQQASVCSTAVYPPGLTDEATSYPAVNEGFNFGESTNSTVELSLTNSQFIAISGFNLTEENFRRRMVFEQAPTNYNLIGQATMSISECPGDFSESALCLRTVNNFSNAFFSTDPNDNPALYCILDPTKSYFINFVTSPDPYVEAPSCNNPNDTTCTIFYSETSF